MKYLTKDEAEKEFDKFKNLLVSGGTLNGREHGYIDKRIELKSFLNTTRINDLHAIRDMVKDMPVIMEKNRFEASFDEQFVNLTDLLSLLDNLENTLK